MRFLTTLGLMFMSSVSFAELIESPSLSSLLSSNHWGLIRSDTTCIEHYKFSDDGAVEIKGNQEVITGRYSVLTSEKSFELPAVAIQFETDNQKADCTGSAQNQAGMSTVNFLKKQSNEKIYFCVDSLGKNCPVYIRPENP
ncbi:hypothetical protein DJ533_02670 [Acinetobacter defluvii]|uniref:Uncharacterized protein n=1 Tax=Acinetobacter defluvii TaxID=1871111 RepID=A0A2S2F9G1_9GAMM|nr:hypothetical protein [Acinetobacter defluvii]AWL27577.1 hypothetical protein DJ533_02670 [Acinetobacter defluvii]